MYMVVAFEQSALQCEVGGDGKGLTAVQASHFAQEFRQEYPGQIVAILPARKSWLGGWPYE